MKLLLQIAALAIAALPCSFVAQAQGSTYRTEIVSLNKDLVSNNAIFVRKILNGLRQGDYVDSLFIVASAIPSRPQGGDLHVYVDQRLVRSIQLSSFSTRYTIPIRALNGIDYSRISIVTSSIARVYQVGVKILVNSQNPFPPPPPPIQPPSPPSLVGQYCAEYSQLVGPAVPENENSYCVDWSRISSVEYNSNSCAGRSGTVQCVRDGHYDQFSQCIFDGPSKQPGLFPGGQIIIPNNRPRSVTCLN